jgi:dihydrodipicolinate synthase/N-acetylneuraminate lyase
MLLHGIFLPITTPFYPDGRLYHRKLQHNVERYSKAPISGIVALGSTGEAIMLSDDERREVLREVRDAASNEKVLIAGTGGESAIETLKLTEYAASLDYDAVLVRTPHFYKPQMRPENLLTFYRAVADRSPIPVLIYSVPVFTGYDMPLEMVVELAEHRNIIGIKESSGNVEKIGKVAESTRNVHREVQVTEIFAAVTKRMLQHPNQNGEKMVPVETLTGPLKSAATAAKPKLKARTKDAGFQVLSGSAHVLLDCLNAGAVGGVLAFADCAPTACFEIYTAWKDRDEKLAREKQERIVEAAKRVVSYYGIPGIKYAQDLNGYYGGPARLPLLPLASHAKTEIDRLMARIKN